MKKLWLILLIVILMQGISFAWDLTNGHPVPYLHGSGCYILTDVVETQLHFTPEQSLGTVVIVGAGKEISDGRWDWQDFTSDIIGWLVYRAAHYRYEF